MKCGPRADVRPTLLLAVLTVTATVTGCDGDQWRTVEVSPESIAAADSLGPGEDLELRLAFRSSLGPELSDVRWETLDVETLSLRVFQRYRESDRMPLVRVTAPVSPTVAAVLLENPPERAFRVVCGDLVLHVEGGAEPTLDNRLTVEVHSAGEPVAGLRLRLRHSGSGPFLELPTTDANGETTLLGACQEPGAPFWVELVTADATVPLTFAQWPTDCATPQRLVTKLPASTATLDRSGSHRKPTRS